MAWDFEGLLKDPEFQKLSPQEKRQLLDEGLAESTKTEQISPEEYAQFQQGLYTDARISINDAGEVYSLPDEPQMDTTPVAEQVAPEPLPAANLDPNKGPLTGIAQAFGRAGEVVGDIGQGVGSMASELYDKTIGEVVRNPAESAKEIGRTANALVLDPLDKALGGDIGGPSASEGINKLLGGLPDEISDTQLATLFGIGRGVGNLAQGAASLPSDVGNTLSYILTGKKDVFTPNQFPDYLSPQEKSFVDQTMSKEPLAAGLGAVEPYLIPIPGIRRVGGLIAEDATKFAQQAGQNIDAIKALQRGGLKNVTGGVREELGRQLFQKNAYNKAAQFGTNIKKSTENPLVGLGIESAMGAAADPEGQTDPVKRLASRGAQVGLAAAATGVGYAGARGFKAVSNAAKVERLREVLKVDLNTAKKLVADGKYEAAMRQAKKLFPELKALDEGLTPEQTATKPDYNLVGNRQQAIAELQSRGMSKNEAVQAYKEAKRLQDERQGITDYKSRQAKDAEINAALKRSVAPFPGARTKNKRIFGGEKGLLDAKDVVLVRQARDLGAVLNIDPVQAKGILEGLQAPLERFGSGRGFLNKVSAIQARLQLLSTSNLLTEVPSYRGVDVFNAIQKNLPLQAEAINYAQVQLNAIRDKMLLRGRMAVEKIPGLSAPIKDVAELLDRTVKDGTLYRIMKGDTKGMNPKVVSAFKTIADDLIDFNKKAIIPKLREIYDLPEFDSLRQVDFERGIKVKDMEYLGVKLTDAQAKDWAKQAYELYQDGNMTPDEAKMIGAYWEPDPTKISNAQRGQLQAELNLDKLRNELSQADYDKFIKQHGTVLGEVLDNNGNVVKPGKKIALLGYVDSAKEVAEHFNDAKQVYERDFPQLYDADGRFREDLVITKTNLNKEMADLANASKLDPSQFKTVMARAKQLVKELESQSDLSKSELNKLFSDEIIKGNVRNLNRQWSKFVGSLQRSENKLIMKNTDPFNSYFQQTAELSKKLHIEPIVNEIRQAIQSVDTQIESLNNKPVTDTKELSRLRTERDWYQDLERMYRNVPHPVDQFLTDVVTAMAPSPLKTEAERVLRKAGDSYVGLQAMAKLGFNPTAGLLNILEGLYSLAPEAIGNMDVVVTDLLRDIRTSKLSPGKFLEQIAIEATGNPAVFFITGKTADEISAATAAKQSPLNMAMAGRNAGGVLDTAFAGSDKMFGSRTVGKMRDIAMWTFSTGTTVEKLLSYRFLKRLGARKGIKGAELEDWVTKMMTTGKRLPEFDKIPLTSRSKLASAMLVLNSYMLRVADHAKHYWGRVLENPSPNNIQKAMMFDLAPTILFGAKSSVSLSAALKVMDTFGGVKNFNEDNEYVSTTDRLKVSDNPVARVIGKGVVGEAGLDVSNLIGRDLTQLLGPGQLIPVSEAKNFGRTSQAIITGVQLAIEGKTDNERAAGRRIVGNAIADATRSFTVAGNRAAKAADIFSTGQIRDRQGNKIIDLPDQSLLSRSHEAVLQALGITNSKAQQEAIKARLVKQEYNDVMEKAKVYRSEITKTMHQIAEIQRVEKPSPERNAKLSELGQKVLAPLAEVITRTTGTGPEFDAFIKPLEDMNKTALQRVFESLPLGFQAKLMQDQRTRKLFKDFYKPEVAEPEQQGIDQQTINVLVEDAYNQGREQGKYESGGFEE